MPKLKVYIKNNQKNVKIPVGLRLLVRKSCAAVLPMSISAMMLR